MRLIVVNRDPGRAIVRQQVPDNLQPIPHQSQPNRMLQPIVIMLEGAASVVRRVDENAFHLARKLRLQRLERQQVVAEYQTVVEVVIGRNAVLGVIRLLGSSSRIRGSSRGRFSLPIQVSSSFCLPMLSSFNESPQPCTFFSLLCRE